MKRLLFPLLLSVNATAWANNQAAGQLDAKDLEAFAAQTFIPRSGYAYGEGHCYGFTAPKGWKLDNSLADQGVAMAFLPQGATWQNADIAMYTRSVSHNTTAGNAMIQAQITDVKNMYRESGVTINAEKALDIQSDNGEKGEIWRYTGYSVGTEELAAYFATKTNVDFFVAQVGRNADKTEAFNIFLELAKSYHQREECKPCKETGCTSE